MFKFLKAVIAAWLFLMAATVSLAVGQEFKVAIMQAQRGTAQQFSSLDTYLQTRGVNIRFIGAPSYPAAASMFANGRVDGMFSGSGVAGAMILKDVAYPVLRPESQNGRSTYWALIVAPRDSPAYTGKADYFQRKRVICCSLASSGEFFFRSIPGIEKVNSTLLAAPSHGAALAGLNQGAADVAIVKNWVWDSLKKQYPKLAVVGTDHGENPDGTLIVSKKADPQIVKQFTSALLALQHASGVEAVAARNQMRIGNYIETSVDDFAHTIDLLKRAGVDHHFDFESKDLQCN